VREVEPEFTAMNDDHHNHAIVRDRLLVDDVNATTTNAGGGRKVYHIDTSMVQLPSTGKDKNLKEEAALETPNTVHTEDDDDDDETDDDDDDASMQPTYLKCFRRGKLV
jgi:hypothetical protein